MILPHKEASTLGEVKAILAHLEPSAVVFLDVDDTLITPKSAFFHATSPYRMLIDEIKADPEAYPHADEIISAWRLARKTQLVSEDWPEVLTQLKAIHPVYALTKLHTQAFGRIPSMEKWRYDELSSHGLTFTPTYKGEEEIVLPKDTQHPYDATFYKGIFITGSYKKSDVIRVYLQQNKPSQLVLIDDRMDYLEDALEECQRQGLPFIGILYRGIEKIQGMPDPVVAEFQRDHLLKACEWLEDEDAKRRLLRPPSEVRI